MSWKGISLLVISMVLATFIATPSAWGSQELVTFDENGVSSLPATLENRGLIQDPFTGGGITLAYQILFTSDFTEGDVLVTDGAGGPTSDLLRFEQVGDDWYLFVYSLASGTGHDLADVGIPTSLQSNRLAMTAVPVQGGRSGISEYWPAASQPGYVGFEGDDAHLGYTFLGDSASAHSPEPGSLVIWGLLGGGLAAAAIRRRKAASRRLVRLLVIGLAVAWVGPARAAVVDVGDTHLFWGSTDLTGNSDTAFPDHSLWQMSSKPSTYVSGGVTHDINLEDRVGSPNFDVALNNLEYRDQDLSAVRVTFRYTDDGSRRLVPGDLFIDVNQDFTWDYVVHNPDPLNPAAATWNVYRLLSPYWDYATKDHVELYELSQNALQRNGSPWTSANRIRYDHPWRVADVDSYGAAILPAAGSSIYATKIGTAQFSGYVDGNSTNHGVNLSYSFTFDSNAVVIGVAGGPCPYIGHTVNCANDVVWQTLSEGDLDGPVPEPGSLAIWGLAAAGLAGAAAVRRRASRLRAKPGRTPWSEENRAAILRTIQRGLRSDE